MKNCIRNIIIACLLVAQACFARENMDRHDDTISIHIDGASLQEVTEEIYSTYGYKILYPEEKDNLPVRGRFKDISVYELIARLFKGENYSVVLNEKKEYEVRLFGEKEKNRNRIKRATPTETLSDLANNKDILQKLHSQQLKAKDCFANDTCVDPLSGMAVSEIKKLHAEQLAELEDCLASDTCVDPLSGMTLLEIKTLHQKQNQEKKDSNIDPLTGMSYIDIQRLHEAQVKELNRLKQSSLLPSY